MAVCLISGRGGRRRAMLCGLPRDDPARRNMVLLLRGGTGVARRSTRLVSFYFRASSRFFLRKPIWLLFEKTDRSLCQVIKRTILCQIEGAESDTNIVVFNSCMCQVKKHQNIKYSYLAEIQTGGRAIRSLLFSNI
jgi:hypothetical protein